MPSNVKATYNQDGRPNVEPSVPAACMRVEATWSRRLPLRHALTHSPAVLIDTFELLWSSIKRHYLSPAHLHFDVTIAFLSRPSTARREAEGRGRGGSAAGQPHEAAQNGGRRLHSLLPSYHSLHLPRPHTISFLTPKCQT